MAKLPPEQVLSDAEAYDSAEAAVERLKAIYGEGRSLLREHFERFVGGAAHLKKADARYPAVWIEVAPGADRLSGGLSYGAVPEAGTYSAVLTNPELFESYYLEQLQLLLDNHGGPLWVGISQRQIPLTFALENLTADLRQEQVADLARRFNMPDLAEIDDDVANGTYRAEPGAPKPLSLFTAERVDYSLSRLRHYSGTSPDHFQRFVLFTNYQRYVDEFIEFGVGEIENGDTFRAFVEPGNAVHVNQRLSDTPSSGERALKPPQMPAYHLVKDGHMGVTLVNIGVGPSNAKTITDHVAVLRPHCWLMVGHCGGLRRTQRLGDYVLAHAYARLDHVLDHDLPLEVPIPAIAEVQLALTAAVSKVSQLDGQGLKQHLRTGTVVTTDDRDWELRYDELSTFFNQSRAIAVDMESATIAANGFRLRVPYGTLLCVSDKPLHGEIKLPGMANAFYAARVSQHLRICLEAVDAMREGVTHLALHSRKLRSFDEPPFR
ncbi:MAG: AMP nucleosidase [Rhodospirillaceae bacterium]|nr:AMP nucleosidase [Rhodospirillaceae bacterium]MBT3627082.1 AMP nucleosidase [Rhodospirillaceae bacterium]MBT3925737.1 AMP nucleosidase [Rhodospirillaceae bacterium]MBT4427912.1 AMP nucleosidase [Rhodospirillaceae bacterium]MBT5040313.1 AMP nucleosidase [Rhodospirillaceae bacterium]